MRETLRSVIDTAKRRGELWQIDWDSQASLARHFKSVFTDGDT